MSSLDPELFDRRDPLQPYEMSLENPLTAEHGELSSSFGYVITSCQDQIGHRSLEELQYALEFLNWLMQEADQKHRDSAILELQNGKKAVFETDPRKVLALFQDFDLDDQESFPGASPEDYFAVLALAKCYEAIETQERLTAYERGDSPIVIEGYPEELQSSLYHTAVSARDSLMSESRDLIAFIDGIRFSLLRAKTAGKRGATVRGTAFEELRKKLMATYDEKYQKMTNRQAANRLYRDFETEVERVLHTDDPAQRIAVWIGRHKKTGTEQLS